MKTRLEPAFLDGFGGGRRFALWVLPPAEAAARGSLLCVQPFGEEANLARRVLVAQAARLARSGWSTLLLDLFATGDSDGATGEATLATWRSDLLRAGRLLRQRAPAPFVLWGTRMGALLAEELSATLDESVDALVLWQPALTGTQLIDPLLKLAKVGAVARSMAAAASSASEPAAGAWGRPSGRAEGDAGHCEPDATYVNLAGYRLQRSLVDDLCALSTRPLAPGERGAAFPVLVLGIQRAYAHGAPPPKPLAQLTEICQQAGALVSLRVVPGEPFWSSLEPSAPVEAFEATETFLESVDVGA